MPKGVPNKCYTPEFKKLVVETGHNEHGSGVETGKHFGAANQRECEWKRIYLTEDPDAFEIERRGRGSKGRPRKLPKEAEDDLLAENQRLRAELTYLKNCKPWFCKKSDTKQKAMVLQERRREHNLTSLLELAQLSRSAYYCHSKQPEKGLATCITQTASPFGSLNNVS